MKSVPPENKEQNIAEINFRDLSYAVEAKTFLKFMISFQEFNIFNQNMKVTDPLPHLGFDEVVEKVKKRLPLLEKQKIDDTKEWMKGVKRLLEDLLKKTEKWLQENKESKETGAHNNQIEEEYLQKKGNEVHEIQAYLKSLETLFQTESNEEISKKMETIHQTLQNVDPSNDN